MNKDGFWYEFVIGNNKRMLDIFTKVKKICTHDVPVLIEGESGTGKELIARAIHYNSARKGNEFVVINCSAFSDALLESELFGHMKGSFTGAVHEKKGLFEFADKGTFFLDEIADMSPALQVKLLRVLQEGTFLKIGGLEPVKVDIRIIAASNKSLKDLVEKEKFREDLFYRINVTSVDLPPLRERKEDIPLLIDYFTEEIAKRMNMEKLKFSEDAFEKIMQYDWPGNIRQLENEVEHAAIFAKDGIIEHSSLSPELLAFTPRDDDFSIDSGLGMSEIKKQVVERLEKRLIKEGLERTAGNKSECAKLLKVSRGDLMRKISKYCLGEDS